jgi:hypothetical protein
MKSKSAYSAFAIAAVLASTQPIMAQGTSGSTGAVASIPGSVVRGHEQGAGLISILTAPRSLNSNADGRLESGNRVRPRSHQAGRPADRE